MNPFDLEKTKKRQALLKALKWQVITGLIAVAIGAGIFLLYYYIRGAKLINAVNGFALTTIVLFSSATFMVLARFGAFDTFSYGFKQLFSSMFGKDANRYNNMADYKQEKYDERKSKQKLFIAVYVVTALFAVGLIIFEIIYHSKY